MEGYIGGLSTEFQNAVDKPLMLAKPVLLAVKKQRQKSSLPMDSEIQRDGRILDLVDDAWKEDKLPYEDVTIPLIAVGTVTLSPLPHPLEYRKNELPEPEQDNGGVMESVKEQEMKWADLALQYLHENIPLSGN
ncbi:unnamed protein product [Ranitomeya imitator]|uniref:Anaphase-promoting complex subunit 13 n=1 Tax=Ranitomeya imitator TaxID=111125 RepID=A0ABN9LWR3_9NEOB|nr:unnamed protein product [Ranitomeya imitator]